MRKGHATAPRSFPVRREAVRRSPSSQVGCGLPSIEGETGWTGCLSVTFDLFEEGRCGTEDVEMMLAGEVMAACIAGVPAGGWTGGDEDRVNSA